MMLLPAFYPDEILTVMAQTGDMDEFGLDGSCLRSDNPSHGEGGA